MKRKQQSLQRQIKRGHAIGKLNPMTGFIEIYRRTTTNKKHTIFTQSIDPR